MDQFCTSFAPYYYCIYALEIFYTWNTRLWNPGSATGAHQMIYNEKKNHLTDHPMHIKELEKT
jgi:hypothetical protein